MTNNSMQAYLAAKYMSGPKADAILAHSSSGPSKKKRKAPQSSSAKASGSSMIKDDDVMGWAENGKAGEDEDDIMTDAVIAEDRGFKKRQRTEGAESSGWAVVREGDREPSPPPAADEQPQIVTQEEEPAFTGGLLTSKQIKKHLPRVKPMTTPATNEEAQAVQETVYRDSSGRKIDMKAERAEAARKKREREEKDAQKMEWGKGLVQRDEVEKRKAEMEKLRGKDFARRIDDEELNEDLKAQERWNDPAAAFLMVCCFNLDAGIDWMNFTYVRLYRKSNRRAPESRNIQGLHRHQTVSESSLDTDGTVLVRYPFPSVKHHSVSWSSHADGVLISDRSNGFEKKLFQHQNERKRRGAESYSWSVDDM